MKRSLLTASLLAGFVVSAASAEPMKLSDQELDRVTAGQVLQLNWSSMDAFRINAPHYTSGAMVPAPDVTRWDHWSQTVSTEQRAAIVERVAQGKDWGQAMAEVLPWQVLAVVSGRGPGTVDHALRLTNTIRIRHDELNPTIVGTVPLPTNVQDVSTVVQIRQQTAYPRGIGRFGW